MVVLVPTLLHASIDVDALATQFKTIIVALDELIVERDARWHCQQHILDELRNRLGIGETADVNSFRLEGENYQIRYGGRQFTLSDSVGLWYLRELLTHPNQVFDPVELESARTGVRGRSSNSPTGESFDAETKREYARKLGEIDEELEEATQFNDLASIERLQSEREKLIDHISKATGKGGRGRVSTDASRARKNVRQQVNRDIDRISTYCSELAEHLRTAFQGESLCYRPTRLAMLQDEVWEITQQYLDARRRGKWLLNHWLDCLVGSAVAASMQGVVLFGTDRDVPEKRNRLSFMEMQGRRRG